jgi:hypothetical protein
VRDLIGLGATTAVCIQCRDLYQARVTAAIYDRV